MTASSRQDDTRARVSAQARISPIWIVPLVAVMIGLWLIYDNYSRRGPQITLEIPNAEGIEAGTLIKTRNVDIGRVDRVELSDDLSHAEITARLSPGSERMLVEDTRFWVVKPRIGREGISGLNTVLSGAYLQLQPGSSDVAQRHFRVLDLPPASPADAEGLRITLISQLGNSLRIGDPVTYQGYTVGRVESAEFDPEARRMRHRLFIESPYDSLVTDSTRFWAASGVDLRLDSEGFRVNVASLESLLGGGVTFGVLEDLPLGHAVGEDASFILYPDEEHARQGTFNRYLEYVLLVDDTVRGLSRGAPVEFRGVRIGTVAAVPWRFSAPQPEGRQGFAIPVLIRIEPQRLGLEGELDLEEWRQRFERLFGLGLRATLKAGNLLTGALFVDINFHQDGEPYAVEEFESRQVFPTISGGLAQIEQKVSSLLDKLNALEVEPILDGLATNLAGTEALVAEVRELTERVGALVDSPETQALPGNVNRALEGLQQTLEGVSPQGEGYQELLRTLERFERLMRDMQPVIRTLDEDPRALLFDRGNDGDPQPRAPRP
ncbi:intermembrane transport protein PqiB [Bisbaumannia pacifica]|uniref:Intermembrane transport protein PqiB n=1 Tax=Bisbaumannia pacifica TaxID=77098 RepID=A0A510X659_9GAMM|nr:intermembrane transport protein PqiB [Halomonas pacifica]MBH8580600.1 intermembrane transport protein PqiB [Halomonas pacifica]GEK45925.1 paraquat-inducible protein B [Halomonas pacifica]